MTKRWLGPILLLYLLITLAYGAVNPLFEAPDEHWHYFTVQYIADTGRLPIIEENYDAWLSQEAAQPPLYYVLGAQMVRLIDTGNPRQEIWLNPHFPTAVGNAAATANKNLIIHTPQEAWPWQGYVLAAHLLRVLSTLFGLGTLLCVYGSGRLLWRHDINRALLATALVAFLPQFNFIHAAISNDSLMTLLASWSVWQVLRLWQTAVTRQRLLLLGCTIGLAALTKTAGILLLIFVLAVLGLMMIRDGRVNMQTRRMLPATHFNTTKSKPFGSLAQAITLILLPTLLIAGWLWWRNWTLYGDITAANQFIRLAGGDRQATLLQVLGETPGLWTSLFAIFGWFNIRPPEWVYWLWNGLVVVAVVGTGAGERRSRGAGGNAPRPTSFILLLWFVAVYAGLITFMLRTPAAQGRLLFPAIVPLALGLAYGLSQFKWVARAAPVLALVTTLYALIFVIPPIYAQPATMVTLPDEVRRLDVAMGDGVQLVGAAVETETAVPHTAVAFTLYWQAEQIPTTAPEVVVELFGRDLTTPIGKLQSYHGRGTYPATLWPTGTLVADSFAVRLADDVAAPVLAQAFVQFADNNQPAIHIGEVKVVPEVWPEPASEGLAQIGAGVILTAVSSNLDTVTPATTTAQPGDTITIMVQWQVMTPPNGDFTTFIHLAEAGQAPLATGDSVPLSGRYPIRVWAAGEVIEDRYTLVVPEGLADGRYPLWLGMYEATTGERLPLVINGERQQFDAYRIEWVTIENK